ELLDAGFEIVIEGERPPSGEADVDAVVVAPPASPAPFESDHSSSAGLVEELTPRERDVLSLVAEGLPNKAIAQALGISDQTVKFHVAAIIAKLGASNRTDAVRRAVRRGLVVI